MNSAGIKITWFLSKHTQIWKKRVGSEFVYLVYAATKGFFLI